MPGLCTDAAEDACAARRSDAQPVEACAFPIVDRAAALAAGDTRSPVRRPPSAIREHYGRGYNAQHNWRLPCEERRALLCMLMLSVA